MTNIVCCGRIEKARIAQFTSVSRLSKKLTKAIKLSRNLYFDVN